MELDEFLHNALSAQHLGDDEHKVGRGGAFGQRAGELETHDLRKQEEHRLVEHHRLGLDATHAPAQHAQTVDHRCVAVRAHERVGIGDGGRAAVAICSGAQLHHLGQVFKVDLVDDTHGGRHDAEVVKRAPPPLEELVALTVAFKLAFGVVPLRQHRAELVHLHRVVDHQINGHHGVDLARVTAQAHHGIAQRRQVDHAGHAGEILQNDTCRLEGDLDLACAVGPPIGNRFDRFTGNLKAIGLAQCSLKQNADRVGKAADICDARLLKRREAIDCGRPAAGLKGILCAKKVLHGHGWSFQSKLHSPRRGEWGGDGGDVHKLFRVISGTRL